MIQPQGLKSRLKAVDKVESKEDESCDIEDHKGHHLEFIQYFGGQIVVHYTIYMDLCGMTKFGLEIEIHKMDYQEHQDNCSSVDHEFGKEGGVGIISLIVPLRPGDPVLDLED